MQRLHGVTQAEVCTGASRKRSMPSSSASQERRVRSLSFHVAPGVFVPPPFFRLPPTATVMYSSQMPDLPLRSWDVRVFRKVGGRRYAAMTD